MTTLGTYLRRTLLAGGIGFILGCGNATAAALVQSEQASLPAPEGGSGYVEKAGWTAKNFMVAAAHPLAVDAGVQILKQGGSALDAVIATQLVLTLVEPQSSGIGGGAFLLHSDGKVVKAFDGRETAPATATDRLFRKPDGSLMNLFEGVVGGRSVGVPGVLRMLEAAHRQYGKLPWASLFAPAIQLSEQGFAVSARLHLLLKADPFLKTDPVAANYFYDAQGAAWPQGHQLKNPDYAVTLRALAAGGAGVFYEGPIANAMVAKVNGHPSNPGGLSRNDMTGYRAREREPVCSDYRQWTVCGMPPPSSGGLAIAQILGMLESRNLASMPPKDGMPDARAVHLYAEAARLAYADRGRYVADTDFVPLPANGIRSLIDKAYLTSRAALITERAAGPRKFGVPPGLNVAWGQDTSPEMPSTSHVSVADAHGNVLSMTTSIENAFGSRQMVGGFLLNNQLTDFSFDSADQNGPVANRVEPGKRPRSSMSPTLVFERGTKNIVMSVGAPGGSLIINYVGKTLIGTLDWGLNMQQAISLPNFGSRNGATELERGRSSPALAEGLKAKGHDVRLIEQASGLHGIMRVRGPDGDVWFGGADPRREGIAKGD